jgi:hypothetical protein
MLYAFSPDCGGNSDVDVSIYPGNEYVDIIGSDCYLNSGWRSPQYLQDALVKVSGLKMAISFFSFCMFVGGSTICMERCQCL